MRKVLVVLLFFAGLLSSFLLLSWIVGLVLYVYVGSDQNYPLIAFVPKWLFIFSPLILLGGSRFVRDFLQLIFVGEQNQRE